VARRVTVERVEEFDAVFGRNDWIEQDNRVVPFDVEARRVTSARDATRPPPEAGGELIDLHR
jgi:hypothetical protein